MERVLGVIGATFDLIQQSFDGVNAVQGLVVAIIATYTMSEWKRLWLTALCATVVLLPVIVDRVAPHPPPLTSPEFWQRFAGLYVGYIVLVATLFAAKRSIFAHADRLPPTAHSP